MIQARLDRLPDHERLVLQQASVVGKIFWDALVSYINRETNSADLSIESELANIPEYLDTLQERDMILHHKGSAFSNAVEYSFKHAILQEVTYESVLKRARRLYHAMVADWLILHSGDRVGEVTGLIANHLEKAGKNKEALEYLCMAAEMAAAKYAIDEAADFYAKIEAARLMLWKACWAMDKGGDFRLEASMAKYLAVMVAREVTLWAADLFGAASVMFEHPVHKFPMDAWAASLGEGTQDVQKLVIFREIMKRYDERKQREVE